MKTKAIKRWSFDEEIPLVEIAREAGASKALVSFVIRGMRTNGEKAREVIRVLLERGCPPELLELDPHDKAA